MTAQLGAAAVMAVPAPAFAAAASVELQADFNGDGFADLAVGSPSESVTGLAAAGVVRIFYGGPDGPGSGPIAVQTFTQASLDVSIIDDGGPEAGDRFGAALAVGHIDGGSTSDLVIGVPGEDDGLDTQDSGAIHVLFGSLGGGLTTSNSRTFDQQLAAAFEDNVTANETGDQFGAAVSVAGIDDDFPDEVAAGAPGEDITVNDAGAVYVLNFDGNGVSDPFETRVLHQDESNVEGVATAGDRFGAALATGDFGKDNSAADAFDDLAVGIPGDEVNGVDNAGSVAVFYGSASNSPSTVNDPANGQANDQLWNQGAALPGSPQAGDGFGTALAGGDFNNNAPNTAGQLPDDLAVGIPGKDGGKGNVQVIYRVSNQLSPTGSQIWSQNTPGISETGNANDNFGASLAAADFNGDDRDDLAVGVPNEDREVDSPPTTDMGSVNVIYGNNSAGLGTDHQIFLNQLTLSGVGPHETGDRFGAALTAGDYDHNGEADLVVGVPEENVAGTSGADHGQLNVVFGRDRFGAFGFGGLDPDDTKILQRPAQPLAGGRFAEALR
ncbi:MAG: FG-GAP repeat protein [Gammaproteobacteria bacterium]